MSIQLLIISTLQALYPTYGLTARTFPIKCCQNSKRVSSKSHLTLCILIAMRDYVYFFIYIFLLCVHYYRYLEVEWEVKKGSKRSFSKDVMKGSNPKVPQQNNFSDCGVYVLQYVESFFEVGCSLLDLM